jgi:hypothetical protein
MFAGFFRTLGLEARKIRGMAPLNVPLDSVRVRPNSWNRVRGAASEPDCIAATFSSTPDDNVQNFLS